MDAVSIVSNFCFKHIQEFVEVVIYNKPYTLCIWFIISYYLNRFLYMFKIFQLTEQNMYIQVTYKNPMFCTYVLHKRHGQFLGVHLRIFFLNSVGDTILFNSVGKMFHIFGPKLDIVSERYMTLFILLLCSVALFLGL